MSEVAKTQDAKPGNTRLPNFPDHYCEGYLEDGRGQPALVSASDRSGWLMPQEVAWTASHTVDLAGDDVALSGR